MEIDVASGRANLTLDNPIPEEFTSGQIYHLSDVSNPETPNYLGSFELREVNADSITLTPQGQRSPDELEQLSFSLGPWTLSPSPPGQWPNHYAATFAREDRIPAELFLILDPLVSLSTSIANRSWVWSLGAAGIILGMCILIPRGFCGYLCPLGTLIDLFDWSIGKHVKRFRLKTSGWWVHLKYYLLLGTLVAGLMGVLVSGALAAIPVVTRGLLYTLGPIQDGLLRGWHQVPPISTGQWLSIGLFLTVLALGFLQPRFWCKYVCPSGAVFSVANIFRSSERKVESSCIHCHRCVDVCPFDAIKDDFTTRTLDCTLCQTCGGVCPTHAIKFVPRWDITNLKPVNEPPTNETKMGRRGFLASGIGGLTGIAGGLIMGKAIKASNPRQDDTKLPVRPPGSVPEKDFLELCIRCGECFKVCPNNVLQAEGFEQGWEGLWTPKVAADWAGCEPSCNSCGQVCPTGAIRALPLEEKRHARMGLAIIDEQTCLPFANREACQLCVDECVASGYDAIDFVRVHTELDLSGNPIEGSGFLAPRVRAEACVGCGLCQTRCFSVNAKDKKLLSASAVVVETGPNREDRLTTGSYIERARLRNAEGKLPASSETPAQYLPDFLRTTPETRSDKN